MMEVVMDNIIGIYSCWRSGDIEVLDSPLVGTRF